MNSCQDNTQVLIVSNSGYNKLAETLSYTVCLQTSANATIKQSKQAEKDVKFLQNM